jgi:hypothetical protein
MAGVESKNLDSPDEVRTRVVGDEPFVGVEFKSAADYAKV